MPKKKPYKPRKDDGWNEAADKEHRRIIKEKANKYDELVEKSGNGDDVIDIEGQKWLRMHPEMDKWAEMNKDMIEWMTEATSKNRTPRSDCG